MNIGAYDINNTSLLTDKIGESDSPGQFIALIDFVGKNTFVCTSYAGYLNDEWKVRNGVRQGGILPGILFDFYLSELISVISKLPVGGFLNCSKVSILRYAGLFLVAQKAQALNFLLNALTSKLFTLILQVKCVDVM